MVVVLLLAAMLLHTVLTNAAFEWTVVFRYFLSGSVLAGLLRTLELTILAMVIGLLLGVVLAVMRLSTNPLLSAASWLYIYVFRGTPLLVQLIFWFNLSALYPTLSLGIPFGPAIVSGSTNRMITPLGAAILGLALNEAAYLAEIVRGGLESVDPGQTEAAQTLGMTRMHTLRRVVLPQAMRVIVPPTGNETINMLKTTALVSVLAMPELLYSVQIIYSRTYETIPLLITASLWYLIVTSILTIGQFYVERHYGKGRSGSAPVNPALRLLRGFVPRHSTAARVRATSEASR